MYTRRSVRLVLADPADMTHTQIVDFAQLPDDNWASDAVVIARRGAGRKLYAEAIYLSAGEMHKASFDPYPVGPRNLRLLFELPAVIIGWLGGKPGLVPTAAARLNDRDWVQEALNAPTPSPLARQMKATTALMINLARKLPAPPARLTREDYLALSPEGWLDATDLHKVKA